MEPHGTRLTLRITDPLDLNRDVLKVQLQLLLQYWILKSYSEIARTGAEVLSFSWRFSGKNMTNFPECSRELVYSLC